MTKSVLLVEDEASIATALTFMLRRDGYELRHVSDGNAALTAVREQAPDLVLLDIMLPGCSGYDVCQAIRRDTKLSSVKILMMTAKGGGLEQRKALAMQANGFIAKPFAAAELREKVHRLTHGDSND